MMPRIVFAFLLVSTLVACSHEPPPPTDPKTIVGTWVGTTTEGAAAGGPNLDVTWVFTEKDKTKELTITNPPGSPTTETTFTYSVDPMASPKWLELTGDVTIHASYRLTGDELIVWYDPKPGADRPFHDENQAGMIAVRLKRKT